MASQPALPRVLRDFLTSLLYPANTYQVLGVPLGVLCVLCQPVNAEGGGATIPGARGAAANKGDKSLHVSSLHPGAFCAVLVSYGHCVCQLPSWTHFQNFLVSPQPTLPHPTFPYHPTTLPYHIVLIVLLSPQALKHLCCCAPSV